MENYPNNPLTLVIWSDVRKEFADKPEEFFKIKWFVFSAKWNYSRTNLN